MRGPYALVVGDTDVDQLPEADAVDDDGLGDLGAVTDTVFDAVDDTVSEPVSDADTDGDGDTVGDAATHDELPGLDT